MKTHHSLLSLFFVLAACAASAFASDAGRIALAPDTTPGNASFIYRITIPGSYYLSANIVGVVGKGGIEITVGDVTLDLNGFTVIGPGTGSSSAGIYVNQPNGPVAIFNGSVRNWRANGLVLHGASFRLESINASDNSSDGIRVFMASTGTIVKCVAEGNGNDGFGVWHSSGSSSVTLSGNVAHGNSNNGFFVVSGSLHGCTATSNQRHGFDGFDVTLVASAAYNNKNDGFHVGRGTVLDSTAVSNGGNGIYAYQGTVQRCSITTNGLNGVFASGMVLVRNNHINSHRPTGGLLGGAGIFVDQGGSRIEGNNLSYNSQGIRVVGTDNTIVGNTAQGSNTNYVIAAGNRVGAIVVPPLSGAISGNSGGGTGATDPWSNLAY